MRLALQRVLAIGVLLTGVNASFAYSSAYLRTRAQLSNLEYAMRMAQRDGYVIPQSVGLVAFLQTPALADYFDPAYSSVRLDSNGWPLDDWGQRLVYMPPILGNPVNLNPAAQPLFRSVGENGADNGGSKDDLQAGLPIQSGYYWKRHWPLARSWTIVFSFGFLCLLTIFFRCRHRLGLWTFPIIFGYLGIALITTIPNLISPWLVGGMQNAVRWASEAYAFGWLFLLASIIMTITMALRRHLIVGANRCLRCRYSLVGLPEAVTRCPECGEEFLTDPASPSRSWVMRDRSAASTRR